MVKLTSISAFALSAAMALMVTTAPQTAHAQLTAAVAHGKASAATDISARRYARRGYRNNAAGAAFAGIALGTIGAVIANQQRRDYYRQNYYYGGNPITAAAITVRPAITGRVTTTRTEFTIFATTGHSPGEIPANSRFRQCFQPLGKVRVNTMNRDFD